MLEKKRNDKAFFFRLQPSENIILFCVLFSLPCSFSLSPGGVFDLEVFLKPHSLSHSLPSSLTHLHIKKLAMGASHSGTMREVQTAVGRMLRDSILVPCAGETERLLLVAERRRLFSPLPANPGELGENSENRSYCPSFFYFPSPLCTTPKPVDR